MFMRFPDSQVGPDTPIVARSSHSEFDFEASFAGDHRQDRRHVAKENAFDYVAGYSCFGDHNAARLRRTNVKSRRQKLSSQRRVRAVARDATRSRSGALTLTGN